PAVPVEVCTGVDLGLDQRVAGGTTAGRLAGNGRPADVDYGDHCRNQGGQQERAPHSIRPPPIAPQRRNGMVPPDRTPFRTGGQLPETIRALGQGSASPVYGASRRTICVQRALATSSPSW